MTVKGDDGKAARIRPAGGATRRMDPSAAPTVIAAAGALADAGKSFSQEVPGEDALMSIGEAASPDSERYLFVRELGKGGMGRVEVMFDRLLGRVVARKRVLDGPHDGYLFAEAQIGAQLEHPSIVPVHDLGTDEEGRIFYTMRVVGGRTLRDVLEDNRDPRAQTTSLSRLLSILRQVCLAVDYAHSRGVVHRDLKPENIMLGSFGEVYVLDWGVACVSDGSDLVQSERLPGSEAIAGSPGYMAPEQALGEPVDARTDVFALGVMLHEMLLGELPFEDADLVSVVKRAQRYTTPASLHGGSAGVPREFVDLVRDCLRKSPAERPASARAIAEAIDSFLDAERDRAERLRDADALSAEGDRAWREHEQLRNEAIALQARADATLAALATWEPADQKRAAWQLADQARSLRADAARAVARAESAYVRALGRLPEHGPARAGLARLYYEEFLRAERQGDRERMTQHLALARSYDAGALSLELADEGELAIESFPATVQVSIARYEPVGPLLGLGTARELGTTPVAALIMPSGSYCITATLREKSVRYPLVIERARRHRLRLRVPGDAEIPDDLVLVPGGRFRIDGVEHALIDFAVGRFPITFREYARFLESLDDAAASRRAPGLGGMQYLTRARSGEWRITDETVEGEARRRVSAATELDLPVHGVSWYDASHYAAWLANQSQLAYRLPTALEWEKAMRGADGRSFPMGNELDPSFAKLRQSRPEASQPEPVGAFALDCSPYGVCDLAGGVADWTQTFLDGLAPPVLEDEGDADVDARQATYCGGHWGSIAKQRGVQYHMSIKHRSSAVGFRLALSLDQHESSELVVEPMRL